MTHPGAYTTALAFTLAEEGGYANHPADRGGPTMRGVTQSVYDSYRKSLHLPRTDVRDITDAEVAEIYCTRYWRPAGCDVMAEGGAPRLALLHFDSAVNHGVGRAVLFLQRCLSIAPDGVFGPVTSGALTRDLGRLGEDALLDAYLLRRSVFYRQIVERDPTQAVFARGWANRLERVRRAVIA